MNPIAFMERIIMVNFITPISPILNLTPHPTHLVISVLKQTQEHILTVINSIKNNVHNPMDKKDKFKI